MQKRGVNYLIISFFFLIIFASNVVYGQLPQHEESAAQMTGLVDEEKEFNAVEMIMHHISDSNEWHLWTTVDEAGEEHHVSIPLPVILISNGELLTFMSNKVAHGHEYEGFIMSHGRVTSTDPNVQRANIGDLFSGLDNKYIDLSITKNVAGILVSIVVIMLIFVGTRKAYARNNGVPSGIASFTEPIILFIRDEVAIPNIGHAKAAKFLPLLLTMFFFIWINNLLGLVPLFPGGANVTGNIAVTLVLAFITFVTVTINGNKSYWGHVFKPPGVPVWLLPIMIPVEFLGLLTKPFALMMRLFANITAGHIMILSLVSLVFMFKSLAIAPASVALALFVSVLELLVAALQAYIFTVLTALFIGMAVHEEHH
ncbi:MAG: F0F1 ATP synthase subunit A [Flavobacterium sp.]|nr:F0F1 ATP synthase subunit A [Flavobacterium sp.]